MLEGGFPGQTRGQRSQFLLLFGAGQGGSLVWLRWRRRVAGLHSNLDLGNLRLLIRQIDGETWSELTDFRRDRAVGGVDKKFPQPEVGNPNMRPESLRQCGFQKSLELEQALGVGCKPRHAVTGGKVFLETARCHRN